MDATVAFLSLSFPLCTSTCLQNLCGRPLGSLLPFLVTLESTVDVTWTVWMHTSTLAMAPFHPRREAGSDPSNRVCFPIQPKSIGFEPGFESVSNRMERETKPNSAAHVRIPFAPRRVGLHAFCWTMARARGAVQVARRWKDEVSES